MCGTMGLYDDVLPLLLGGKVRDIDRCIAHIVAALNAGGVETVACCCGHGKQHGRITLADGRELVIMSEEEAAAHFRSKRSKVAACPTTRSSPAAGSALTSKLELTATTQTANGSGAETRLGTSSAPTSNSNTGQKSVSNARDRSNK